MTNNRILEEITNAAREDGTIKENENLHTFQYWKSIGFSVKKGEHAKITTKLWKKSSRKKDEDEEEPEDNWFMAKAFLFSDSQVEAISKSLSWIFRGILLPLPIKPPEFI